MAIRVIWKGWLRFVNNLYLIEDAAEALGSKYKGDYVGTFGDIATFSFFGNKTITTGKVV